jgi:hypothetical protein
MVGAPAPLARRRFPSETAVGAVALEIPDSYR